MGIDFFAARQVLLEELQHSRFEPIVGNYTIQNATGRQLEPTPEHTPFHLNGRLELGLFNSTDEPYDATLQGSMRPPNFWKSSYRTSKLPSELGKDF